MDKSTPLPGNTTPTPLGGGGVKLGRTYLRPKDSNAAVGVRNRAAQKAPEGYDKQTDSLKQTNFPRIIVR